MALSQDLQDLFNPLHPIKQTKAKLKIAPFMLLGVIIAIIIALLLG